MAANGNQNRKNESIRRANRVIQSRTFVLMLIMGILMFVLLFFRLYDLQITRHEELQGKAVSQQTRRTAGSFTHRVQQTQTLLDNRLFIQNLTAQRREGRTQALRFFHHKLRCALLGGNIRQAAGGNHPVGDGLLLLKQRLKARQFVI